MSENIKKRASKSESFLQWEDWVVLLTGGMVTTGAIGWIVYRSLDTQKLDYRAIKAIATSFVGGMGIYFTSSAIVFMYRKSSVSRVKSTTSKDDSNLPVMECETSPYKRIVDVINELDRKFAYEASKVIDRKDLNNISKDIQEAAKVHCKSEDMIKRLNALNRQGPKNALLKLSTDNQMEACNKEDIGFRKAKFREEIISYISELKGYVQGAIDPFPLAKNFQFRSSEINDEMCHQVVAIVKEYANTMLPKFEQVFDDFMESVSKYSKVRNDKVKKALDTFKVSEKLSKVPQKTYMDQYNVTLENDTKSKSQSWQQSKNAYEHKIQSHESGSSPFWMNISELQNPVIPKYEMPSSAGISLMSQGVNKLDHRAVEKLETRLSNPCLKLTLNQEQMQSLNVLKSEL